MLLTLSLSSPDLVKALSPTGLLGVPAVVREQFGLSGLNVSTSLLKGADRKALGAFRDAADRAGCACLVLVEPPLALGVEDQAKGDQAEQRVLRLVEAASLLGCNSLAVGVEGEDTEEGFENAVDRLRVAAEVAEKRELNILIAPHDGLTSDPDRVSELIKRVGGFRVGTYPDFEAASKTDDPASYLRRLAPFAWSVSASTLEFEEPPPAPESEEKPTEKDKPDADEGADKADAPEKASTGDPALDALLDEMEMMSDPPVHPPYDLGAMVSSIAAVGYDGTLAIDYRGTEGTLGVRQSCEALEFALEQLG